MSDLYLASANGDAELVRSLIANGSNLDEIFSGDFKPLFIAARTAHLDIVDILITNGATWIFT